jgi:hypothetical protein
MLPFLSSYLALFLPPPCTEVFFFAFLKFGMPFISSGFLGAGLYL